MNQLCIALIVWELTCRFLAAMESMNCLVLFSGSVGEFLGETEALWSPVTLDLRT